MELLGNLLDNAYHWCQKKVFVELSMVSSNERLAGLGVIIEDDGCGVSSEQAQQILCRGVTDAEGNGHGIGLALVRDIVALYEGKIELSRSSRYGGLAVHIHFPGRA